MEFKKAAKTLELDKIINQLKQETISPMAKEICDNLQPSANFSEVSHWLQETSQARKLQHERELSLRGLKDIRRQLQLARKDGVLQGEDLAAIVCVLEVSDRINKAVDEHLEELCPDICELIKKLPDLRNLRKYLEINIDENGIVRDSASSKLKSLRMKISSLRSKVKSSLNKTLQSNEKYLQDKIITMRNDRYVVPIKADAQGNVPGIVHDQSASGMTVYVEPREVVEINNELSQVTRDAQKEVERILRNLSLEIKEQYTSLMDTLQILVELDYILAKGALSKKMGAREPELNNEKFLKINQGVHPLLGQDAVPVDVELGGAFSTLVITGPNTGGKTVTLKMVGLFSLMTQIGLHIPAARGTEMSVFEKVFADIGDEQNIEQSLSTFSSHMSNIVTIIKKVSRDSLILLDELGAGTDPTEGSALAMAILEYLHRLGARSIATTHYTQLKNFAHAREGVENASVEFDEKTLMPTYKLLIGIPGKSNAFVISKRLGLDEAIINSAKSFLADEEIEVEDLISSLTEKEKSTQKLKEELEAYKSQLELKGKELRAKEEELVQKRERLLSKAREEASEIIVNAKRDAEQSLKEVRKLSHEQSQQQIAEVSGKVRERLSKHQEQLHKQQKEHPEERPVKISELKPGMSVYVSTLDKQGTIKQVQAEKEEAEVQVGIMKVNVPCSNLYTIPETDVKHEDAKGTAGQYRNNFSDKKASLSPELDIRGKLVDEAISVVEKYLDDATVAGLKRVQIIHGKGTGNLRKGVQFHLEGHPLVDSYRIGTRSEGGEGVTVVELSE